MVWVVCRLAGKWLGGAGLVGGRVGSGRIWLLVVSVCGVGLSFFVLWSLLWVGLGELLCGSRGGVFVLGRVRVVLVLAGAARTLLGCRVWVRYRRGDIVNGDAPLMMFRWVGYFLSGWVTRIFFEGVYVETV